MLTVTASEFIIRFLINNQNNQNILVALFVMFFIMDNSIFHNFLHENSD